MVVRGGGGGTGGVVVRQGQGGHYPWCSGGGGERGQWMGDSNGTLATDTASQLRTLACPTLTTSTGGAGLSCTVTVSLKALSIYLKISIFMRVDNLIEPCK